jgi:hypothetical protein
MKHGGHMDYHGSRAYAPDTPSLGSGSWLKRLADPFTSWAEYLLATLFKPGAREAAETVWLVHGDERHFSVLGAEYDRMPRSAVAPCPFPEGGARARRPIGFRADSE